eukprot:c15446_g3_i1 orf=36-203(+)
MCIYTLCDDRRCHHCLTLTMYKYIDLCLTLTCMFMYPVQDNAAGYDNAERRIVPP